MSNLGEVESEKGDRRRQDGGKGLLLRLWGLKVIYSVLDPNPVYSLQSWLASPSCTTPVGCTQLLERPNIYPRLDLNTYLGFVQREYYPGLDLNDYLGQLQLLSVRLQLIPVWNIHYIGSNGRLHIWFESKYYCLGHYQLLSHRWNVYVGRNLLYLAHWRYYLYRCPIGYWLRVGRCHTGYWVLVSRYCTRYWTGCQ